LFFIDTSRTTFENVLSYELSNSTPVFDADRLGIDDRCAPVFYASQPGGHAYSIVGQQTLFSAALLECLNGAAAVPASLQTSNDTSSDLDSLSWEITVSSLIDGLGDVLARRRAEKSAEYEKHNVKQEYTVGGVVRDAVIRKLDGAPTVPVYFDFEAGEQTAEAERIEFVNDLDDTVATFDPKVQGSSIQLQLPAGLYRAVMSIGSTRRRTRIRLVKPPREIWKARF
jgi:hypothetical protein